MKSERENDVQRVQQAHEENLNHNLENCSIKLVSETQDCYMLT